MGCNGERRSTYMLGQRVSAGACSAGERRWQGLAAATTTTKDDYERTNAFLTVSRTDILTTVRPTSILSM